MSRPVAVCSQANEGCCSGQTAREAVLRSVYSQSSMERLGVFEDGNRRKILWGAGAEHIGASFVAEVAFGFLELCWKLIV